MENPYRGKLSTMLKLPLNGLRRSRRWFTDCRDREEDWEDWEDWEDGKDWEDGEEYEDGKRSGGSDAGAGNRSLGPYLEIGVNEGKKKI